MWQFNDQHHPNKFALIVPIYSFRKHNQHTRDGLVEKWHLLDCLLFESPATSRWNFWRSLFLLRRHQHNVCIRCDNRGLNLYSTLNWSHSLWHNIASWKKCHCTCSSPPFHCPPAERVFRDQFAHRFIVGAIHKLPSSTLGKQSCRQV